VRSAFLETVVERGEETLVDVLCSTLPHTTVKIPAATHQIDLWPHVVVGAKAIHVAGWGDEGGGERERHIAVVNRLLRQVDTGDLQQRLALEHIEGSMEADDPLEESKMEAHMFYSRQT